jgi:hypothetical protein
LTTVHTSERDSYPGSLNPARASRRLSRADRRSDFCMIHFNRCQS